MNSWDLMASLSIVSLGSLEIVRNTPTNVLLIFPVQAWGIHQIKNLLREDIQKKGLSFGQCPKGGGGGEAGVQ